MQVFYTLSFARKHRIAISAILVLFFGSALSSNCQTVLQAGDLAFLGYQSGFTATPSPKDRFAFVFLKPIEAGTRVIFNDNAVLQNNPLRLCRNENQAIWRATEAVEAGQIVVITEGDTLASIGRVAGVMALAQAGDNITALQAVGSDTNVIAAFATKAWLGTCASTCGGANNNVSCLPLPLVNGQNALALGTNLNNAYFTPTSLSGTPAEILSQVLEPQNWSTSNGEQPWTSGYWGVTVVTSIKASDRELKIQIYPNPASEFVQVTGLKQEVSYAISDLLGRRVQQGFTGAKSVIPIHKLKPGFYNLSISGEGAGKDLSRFSLQIQ